MATLSDIALVVAKQLGRANAAGTAIADLEDEIKAEIGNAVKNYNRKPWHLTEFRDGEITLAAGTEWYSAIDLTSGAGDQDETGRSAVDINTIISTEYMRIGDSNTDYELIEISHREFERYKDGSSVQGEPVYYTRFAGQIGIYPIPNAVETVYWSGTIKPPIPTDDSDTSVWFDEANELIEAGAARRVCTNYLRDDERAARYAATEALAMGALESEFVRKASTGRLRPRA